MFLCFKSSKLEIHMNDTLKFMTCLTARSLLLQYATLSRDFKNHEIHEHEACLKLVVF
jgi:hypothetical protein